MFSSVSIEIFPLSTKEYTQIIAIGVDNLTIYQETYNKSLYDELHLSGPKKDFKNRLLTPERALSAGIRSVNIGGLLGLDNWRSEVFFTGIHANYLQNKFLDSEISVSLPRMQNHAGCYDGKSPVNDKALVQSILALRLFMPRLGISISTRESAQMRENLLPLGVTKMSAGSKTTIGGYTEDSNKDKQFEINDTRSVKEIEEWLFENGYQPVFNDWDILV